MKRNHSITFLCSLFFLSLLTCTKQPSNELVDLGQNEDLRAIEATIKAAYDGLSFTKDKKADFETLDRVFIKEAIFRSFREGDMVTFFKEPYFANYKGAVESGSFEAIVEREIWGKTQIFGNIAQRLSTYELFYNDLSKPQERGVNSFHLVKIDGEWKITSTIYDVEKSGQPIPLEFLN